MVQIEEATLEVVKSLKSKENVESGGISFKVEPRWRECLVVDKTTRLMQAVEEEMDESYDVEDYGEDYEDFEDQIIETPEVNIDPGSAIDDEPKLEQDGSEVDPRSDTNVSLPLIYEEPKDPRLKDLIKHVKRRIMKLPKEEWQITCLAILTFYQYGASLDKRELFDAQLREELENMKKKRKSNHVFLCSLLKGVAYHRSLLFKVLADELAISSTLVRGEYFKGWNEVWLRENHKPFLATDKIRWMVHNAVNSCPASKEEIQTIEGLERNELNVLTGDAPPDSLTISMAMAMAVQNQFLKILVLSERENELSLTEKKASPKALSIASGQKNERICECAMHSASNKCHCCPYCPGAVDERFEDVQCQTEENEEVDEVLLRPQKYIVDLCYKPSRLICSNSNDKWENQREDQYKHLGTSLKCC